MAEFNVKIDIGNDAMSTREDIANALEEVVNRLRCHNFVGNFYIKDKNGNTCGKVVYPVSECRYCDVIVDHGSVVCDDCEEDEDE